MLVLIADITFLRPRLLPFVSLQKESIEAVLSDAAHQGIQGAINLAYARMPTAKSHNVWQKKATLVK